MYSFLFSFFFLTFLFAHGVKPEQYNYEPEKQNHVCLFFLFFLIILCSFIRYPSYFSHNSVINKIKCNISLVFIPLGPDIYR